jgi:hypothetical protein
MDEPELLWKQYQQNVDLYKFYLDLLIKFNVFYYAVTGAIISFVLAHSTEPLIRYALVLPLVMSVGFSAFFIYGAVLMGIPRRETFAIRDALGLKAAPDLCVLTVMLIMFSLICLLVAGGC